MVKLKDIAAQAGVDVSTVSRALGGDPEISASTRGQIEKLAMSMGYKKKIRQVRSGKIPGLVGVIIPEVRSGYYSAMLDRISLDLRAAGKTSLMGLSDFETGLAGQYITGFARAGAEGLILVLDAWEIPLKPQTEHVIRSCGIPVSIISGRYQQDLSFDSVHVDELSGTRKAVLHLIEMGHRSIGYIGETRTPERCEACRTVLRENGLDPDPLLFRSGTERLERGGYLRMKELLAGAGRPSAVFVAYDQMAVGAIGAMLEAGLMLPEDMSVVSFDDISAAGYLLGGLTTVAAPLKDISAVAVQMLLERIDGSRNRAVRHVTIQPSLAVRRSTAPFRARSSG